SVNVSLDGPPQGPPLSHGVSRERDSSAAERSAATPIYIPDGNRMTVAGSGSNSFAHHRPYEIQQQQQRQRHEQESGASISSNSISTAGALVVERPNVGAGKRRRIDGKDNNSTTSMGSGGGLVSRQAGHRLHPPRQGLQRRWRRWRLQASLVLPADNELRLTGFLVAMRGLGWEGWVCLGGLLAGQAQAVLVVSLRLRPDQEDKACLSQGTSWTFPFPCKAPVVEEELWSGSGLSQTKSSSGSSTSR
ncbi:unnamed protein product, partial [Ectocarpus fasciculatus]